MNSYILALFALLISINIFSDSYARKPNVIFILADDLGYKELGSYGQEKIKTPYLDKIAKEGMRFTRNYSGNAVCAPSRCVLMTGKHPGHAFIRNNGEVNHSIFLVDPKITYNSLIFPKNDTSSSFIVNSWHHQGLNDLAKGVIVLARSNDMLPEAIVLDSNLHPFMIAVQFHPERLGENNGISITMRDNFFKAINKK